MNLAAEGWKEGGISHFDAQNLYVKIDGRADFFLSRGFNQLSFVSLTNDARPGTAVDVEFYDMVLPGEQVTCRAKKAFWRRNKLKATIEMTRADGKLVARCEAAGLGVRFD